MDSSESIGASNFAIAKDFIVTVMDRLKLRQVRFFFFLTMRLINTSVNCQLVFIWAVIMIDTEKDTIPVIFRLVVNQYGFQWLILKLLHLVPFNLEDVVVTNKMHGLF